MKILHLSVGLFVVVAFLLTGQFMSFHSPKMAELDAGTRMMFRSRHIYILLAGLINLGIGCYFSYRREMWRERLQITGSILIIFASFLLIGAFFYEPPLEGLQGRVTLLAVVALLIGMFCHLFSGVRNKSQ